MNNATVQNSLGKLLALAWVLLAPSLHAGSHTWSGAVNGNWSTAGNWSAGGVPAIGEASLTMTFPGSATRTVMTNNIGALTVTSMNFSGSNYIVRGASTITFGSSLINVLCGGNSNTIESTLSLPGNFAVSVGDNRVMAFHTLTGAGSLIKFGEGEIQLRGVANNTLSGGYTINVGRLVLAKTGGANAVAAPLTIIGTTNFGQLAFVSMAGSEQTAGNVNVAIHATGGLVLNGHTNTINDLTVMAGSVFNDGLLRLNGDLRLSALDGAFPLPDTSPIIRGNLEFIGASNNITVSNLICEIEANIVEYGTTTALGKDGPGTLWLKGGGNNPGNIYVNAGTLRAGTAASLGTVAGSTTVANGASLIISSGFNTAEPLVLSGLGTDGQGALKLSGGTATCSGTITLGSETGVGVPSVNDTLNLDGPINGGGGIRKFGDGTLLLNGFGNNTFSGASFVAKGKLTLNKGANVRAIGSVTVTNGASLVFNNNELMDNAGVLSIYTGGSVNLTNRNETIGGLNIGRGFTLDTGTGTLTLLGNIFGDAPYSSGSGDTVLRGHVSLGGATRTIDGVANFVLDCHLSDGAGVGGLNFTSGTLWLMRSNSFTGPVIMNGWCRVFNDRAFGAPGGGVFLPTKTNVWNDIFLYGMTAISGEVLTIGPAALNNLTPLGTNSWSGPIVFTNGASLDCDGFGASVLTLSGPISGTNQFLSSSGGTTHLLGTNTYTGLTRVVYDTLVVGSPQALGSTNQGTELRPAASLMLSLNNGAQVAGESLLLTDTAFYTERPTLGVIGSVSNSWSGPVTNLAAPLKVNVLDTNGTLNLNAAISGFGSLEKTGPGKLILAGANANTYSGDTVVTNGTLVLNKSNGVQAVSNLTVNHPGKVVWAANEQIANAATLTLSLYSFGVTNTHANLGNHTETFTQLAMTNTGVSLFASSGGTLNLLGDISSANGRMLITPTIVFPAGTHQITGDNNAYLHFLGSLHETGGSAGLKFTDCDSWLAASNSFSGPLVLDHGQFTIQHPAALGTPAGSTTLTNSALFYLDLPADAVVADEALILASIGGNEIRMYNHATNTLTGPITIQDHCRILHYETDGRLVLTGPVTGPGTLMCNTDGTLVLAGYTTNSFNGLTARAGTVRLAKSPGVPAIGGDVVIDNGGIAVPWPVLILDGPGQLPATTTVNIGDLGTFDLNGYATTIKRLQGFGLVKLGTGLLTISNSAAQYSEFLGTIEGAPGGMSLIKQGIAQQRVGNFNLQGAMSVQGGTVLMDNGSIGALDISAGAVMDMYAPVAHFGSLSGAGGISTAGNGLIYVGGNNLHTVFSGVIFGGSQTNLVKVGTGALTLTGASTDPGKTVVQNGTLLVNGSLAGPVHVQPGAPGNLPTLGGIGGLQNATIVGLGARLSPGATLNVPSYGKLTAVNVAVVDGAIYACEIGGTNAGVNLDQIQSTDTFTLSGVTLTSGVASFTTFGAGVVSNRYAVVKSAVPVSGTFTGMSEGSTFFPSAGRSMQITYAGGASGRDIVLMDLAAIPPGSFSGIQVLTNGTVQIGGQGTPGVLYDVQANANLTTTNWLVIGSVTGDFNGAFSFIDTNAPSFPMRFYRFLLP